MGIRWLSIYIAIRPCELLSLKEKEIDAGLGSMLIPRPKEKRPKMVFLIDEDIEILEI